MNEDLQKLLNAVGSLSELCWVFFNDLIAQGFNTSQALCLTSTFLSQTIRGGTTDD